MRGGWIPDRPEDCEAAPRLGERYGATAEGANLDQFIPEILDQGPASSCTGFGVGYAIAGSMRAHGNARFPMPSPMWLYLAGRRWGWREAKLEDRPPLEDGGARIHDVLQAARYVGFCPADLWPYDASEATAEPPASAYHFAFRMVGAEAYFIDPGPGRIPDIKRAHHNGMLVVSGGYVGDDFFRSDGIEPYEPPAESGLMGHCMTISSLGDDGRGHSPGSYGKKRGDNGWFTLSVEWIERAQNMWAFKALPSGVPT